MTYEMGMDMAMQEVARLVFVDELAEASKTSMAAVFGVMNKAGRGMGDNQIYSPPAPQGKT
jgi:hypothetical protein